MCKCLSKHVGKLFLNITRCSWCYSLDVKEFPLFASRYELFFQTLETVLLPRADVSQFMVTATFLSSQRSLLTCVMFVLVLKWPRWALVVGAACASCNISSDLLLWHMFVVNIQSILLSHTSTRKYHYKCLVCVCTCVFELEQWFTETRLCFLFDKIRTGSAGEGVTQNSSSSFLCFYSKIQSGTFIGIKMLQVILKGKSITRRY